MRKSHLTREFGWISGHFFFFFLWRATSAERTSTHFDHEDLGSMRCQVGVDGIRVGPGRGRPCGSERAPAIGTRVVAREGRHDFEAERQPSNQATRHLRSQMCPPSTLSTV